MAELIFLSAAVVILAGAFGVVLSANPVHSALSLVATLVGVAVLFVQLNAELVAAVQVIVYASAIVVLFLFVIMLLGIDRRERVADLQRPQTIAALVLGLAAAGLLIGIGGDWDTTGTPSASGALRDPTPVTTAPAATNALTAPTTTVALVSDRGNVEAVSETLFTRFGWALQLTAVLLTLAVVGAVILAKRSVSDEPYADVIDVPEAGADA